MLSDVISVIPYMYTGVKGLHIGTDRCTFSTPTKVTNTERATSMSTQGPTLTDKMFTVPPTLATDHDLLLPTPGTKGSQYDVITLLTWPAGGYTYQWINLKHLSVHENGIYPSTSHHIRITYNNKKKHRELSLMNALLYNIHHSTRPLPFGYNPLSQLSRIFYFLTVSTESASD